jgi:aryl-alcohol dehydrogenase-like predicted oxidoreductase
VKYRRLGSSGLIVSALSLGTMQFGEAMNVGRLNQEETTAMINQARDHGVNFIDTADVYSRGESETLIGNAIKGTREELVIATKCRLPMSDTDFNRSGATRANILRGAESSLRRLQTDYIDLYQIHGWDSSTPLEETLRALDDLVRSGKVRYIGLSNYMAWQAMAALALQDKLNLNKYVTAQMYYSLVGRDLEHEFIPFCQYTGMGILVWSPLAGGYLTGKYRPGTPPPEGTRFGEAGQFVMFDPAECEPIVETLRQVAARHGVSPARVAIAWTLAQPMISSVIVAARKPEHLDDNLAAIDLALSADDLQMLNQASAQRTPYPRWMVLQLDQAEDPRPKVLEPERFVDGGPWQDLRFRRRASS